MSATLLAGALLALAPAQEPELVTLDSYHPFEPPASREEWEARRERLRRQVLVAAGLWPLPARTPLEAVVHSPLHRGDYTVEHVYFQSLPGFYVSGNLYRPTAPADGPRPGVLSPHGHWENGRFTELAEEADPGERFPLQARCTQLARMGCVVFHYDMAGYADCGQIPHGSGFTDVDAVLRGQSFFRLQTWNSIRALDFLAGLDDVDATRIGVTGASGGGTQTFVLCAVDDRPAAAFPAVMVSTAMQGGCVCENAPHLRVGTGNVELAGLFAPKPLALSGANDWTIEIETKGLPELKQLYGLFDAAENVTARCWPEFDHNYNRAAREMMYGWFNTHLGLGWKEPVRERPFEPLERQALSVFDDAHPRPEGAADATAVRAFWRDVAWDQLNSLWPEEEILGEHRVVIGGAWEILLHAEEPVAVSETREPRRPTDWNGVVVVAAHDGGPGDFAGNVEALLERGAAVTVVDPPAGPLPVDERRHGDYVGYTWGYNPTLLARRVAAIRVALAAAERVPHARSVRLYGHGDAGPWALLALAFTWTDVERTVAAWSWDFAGIDSFDDPNFLPGALRYGGLAHAAALCAPSELRVVSMADPPAVVEAAYAAAGADAAFRSQLPGAADELLDWLAAE